MARPLRILYPGAYYHVTSRGNEQKDVFRSKRDQEKFLEYLYSVGPKGVIGPKGVRSTEYRTSGYQTLKGSDLKRVRSTEFRKRISTKSNSGQ